MTTYYVLTNIDSYETGAYKHDNLKDALEDYKQKLGYTNPVLVQEVEVNLIATPVSNEPVSLNLQQGDMWDVDDERARPL